MVEGSTSTIGKLSSQVIARHLLDGLQEEQKICETDQQQYALQSLET